MKNITLSADEETIRRARKAAMRQGKSLNQLIREYLEVLSARQAGAPSTAELFALMDQGNGDLEGRTWRRDELHER